MTTYTGGTGITVDNTGNVILVDSTVLRTVTNQTINGVKTFNGTVDFTTATVIGNAGYTGSQGNVGFTGSAGFNGSVGFTGSAGFTGSQSIVPGPQGNIGFTGSAGPEGPTGFSGSQGIQGILGFTGSIGATGPEGPMGPAGDGQNVKAFRTVRVVDSVGGSTNIIADQSEDYFTMESGANISLTVVEDRITISAESPIGFTGSRGFVGSQGFTGSQGSRGFQGSQGLLGNRGAIGYTGSIGFTGSQGVIGNVGYTGSQGLQGNAGQPSQVPGPAGFTGSTGIIGFTGSQGPAGPQGNVGFAGSRGAIGFTGSLGLQGFAGSEGNIGGTGFTGSIGDSGFTGSRGSSGYNGSRGYTGSVGIQGPMGLRGPLGYTGSRGNQGIQGNTGLVGSRGFTGSTGYTGSRGPVGPIGQGVRGYTGSQGVRGFSGSQGEPAEAFRTFRTQNSDGTTSLIIADQPEDVMTFVAAKGITIDFNEATDTITFAGTGEGGGDKGNANVTVDLTVVNNDPGKTSFIAYNSTTGVLEYTPYDLTNYVEQADLYAEIQAANDHANTIVAAEAVIRADADAELLDLINTEVDRLETELGNNTIIINDTIDDANAYLTGLIQAEANLRYSGDEVLQDQIDALNSTAGNILLDLDGNVSILQQELQQIEANSIARDNTLQNNIDAVSDALAQEVQDRIDGDTELSEDLTSNIALVNGRIDIVAQDLAEESNARLVSDILTRAKINKNTDDIANLDIALAHETQDRIAGDDHLQNQIYAQGANDSIVANRLDQEIQDRIDGDEQLQDNLDDAVNLINTELLGLENLINDEANVRGNADLALDGLINIESDRNDVQDGDINNLDIRVDELENRVQLTIDYEANLTPVDAIITADVESRSSAPIEYLTPVQNTVGRVAYVTIVDPGYFSEEYFGVDVLPGQYRTISVFTQPEVPGYTEPDGTIIPGTTTGSGLKLNIDLYNDPSNFGLTVANVNYIVDPGDDYTLGDRLILSPAGPQFGGQSEPVVRVDGIAITPPDTGPITDQELVNNGRYDNVTIPNIIGQIFPTNAATGGGQGATVRIDNATLVGDFWTDLDFTIVDGGQVYRVGDLVDIFPPVPTFGPASYTRFRVTSIQAPVVLKGPASGIDLSLRGQYTTEPVEGQVAKTRTVVGNGTGLEVLLTDVELTASGQPGWEIRGVSIADQGTNYAVGDVVEITNNGAPEFSPLPPRARLEITEISQTVGPAAQGQIVFKGQYGTPPQEGQQASTYPVTGSGTGMVVRLEDVGNDNGYFINSVSIVDGGSGYRDGDRVEIENNGAPEFSPLAPRAQFEVLRIGELITLGPVADGVMSYVGEYSTPPITNSALTTRAITGRGAGLTLEIVNFGNENGYYTITDVVIRNLGDNYQVGDVVELPTNGGPEFSPLGPRGRFTITEIIPNTVIEPDEPSENVLIEPPPPGEFRPLTDTWTVTNKWEDVAILFMNTRDEANTFHFLNAIKSGDDLVFQHNTQDSLCRFTVTGNVELNVSETTANILVSATVFRGEIEPGDGNASTQQDEYTIQFFPAVASDVASYNYVDAQDNLRVLKTGDTMTGSLTMRGGDIIADGSVGSEIRATQGADVTINDSGSLIVNGTGKVYTSELTSLGGGDLSIQKAGSPSIVVKSNETEITNKVARYNQTAALAVGTTQYDLVHKGYLDSQISDLDLGNSYVAKAGDTMFGELAWDDNIINTIKIAPVEGSQAIINYFENPTTQNTLIDLKLKGDSDTNRYRILGGDSAANTMVTYTSSGDIIYSTDVNMNLNKVTNLGDPSELTDAANKRYVDDAVTKSQEDLAEEYVNVTGDTMSGKLTITSGGIRVSNSQDINVEGGDVRVTNSGTVVTNTLNSAGNSNLTLRRNSIGKLLLGTDKNISYQPIKYNAQYGLTDDLDLINKGYVDGNFIKNGDTTVLTSDSIIETAEDKRLTVKGPATGIGFTITRDSGAVMFYQEGNDIRVNNYDFDDDYSVVSRIKGDERYGVKGDFVKKSGDTMTGKLTTQQLEAQGELLLNSPGRNINAEFGVAGQLQYEGATRLKWGNNFVTVTGELRVADGVDYVGSVVDGRINMNNHKIVNLLNPENPQEAATKNYVDSKVAEGGGGSAEGAVLLAGDNLTETNWAIKNAANSRTFLVNKGNEIGIYNVATPTNDHHAMPRSYADGRYLRTGVSNTLTAETTIKPNSNAKFYIQNGANNTNNFLKVLSYSGSELFGVDGDGMVRVPREPTQDTHVANKAYVDDKVANASGGGVELYGSSSPPSSKDRGTMLLTTSNNLYIYV